jgi:nitrite reductase (NADH) small subunit
MTPIASGTAMHPVASLTEIPVGEGRAYAVAGRQIAVFRLRSGAVRATAAVCPHRGGPIADGQLDDTVVVCPLHLFVFDLKTGESSNGLPALQTFPVRVDDSGMVLVLPDPIPWGHS